VQAWKMIEAEGTDPWVCMYVYVMYVYVMYVCMYVCMCIYVCMCAGT